MWCVRWVLPGALFLLLIASPSVVLSLRRAAESEASHQAETRTEIHPIALLVAGTVSVAGSVFSVHKHRRQLAMDKKQKAVAEDIVRTYKEQLDVGCRMLDQTAVLMERKRQGLQRLSDDDRNGTHALSSSCLYDFRMKRFEQALREELHGACQELWRAHASPKIKEFAERCFEAASLEELTARICEENSDGLTRAIRHKDLDMARLDGVMAGLCDGLPGFERTSVKQRVSHGSSLVSREVSGNRDPSSALVALDSQVAVLEMIALSYSILGTMDFGFDLYESSVVQNDGYAVLLDVVNQDVSRHRQLLWNSFQTYWLDVAWMRSVQLATLEERYEVAPGIPPHFWHMKRADTPLLWQMYPNRDSSMQGSYWACSEKLECLVPVWTTAASKVVDDKQNQSKLSTCATSFGDMKLCRPDQFPRDEPVPPFGVAPRRCFAVGFGGKGLSPILNRDVWLFRYGSHDRPGVSTSMTTAPEDKYNEMECLGPLRNLAQSNVAEASLRNTLVVLSKEEVSTPK